MNWNGLKFGLVSYKKFNSDDQNGLIYKSQTCFENFGKEAFFNNFLIIITFSLHKQTTSFARFDTHSWIFLRQCMSWLRRVKGMSRIVMNVNWFCCRGISYLDFDWLCFQHSGWWKLYYVDIYILLVRSSENCFWTLS